MHMEIQECFKDDMRGSDLNMEKVNFPDNVYVKQTLTVEKGENIIYADYLL